MHYRSFLLVKRGALHSFVHLFSETISNKFFGHAVKQFAACKTLYLLHLTHTVGELQSRQAFDLQPTQVLPKALLIRNFPL